MENRLKVRLTGAAILVALVVMLVPEMFHGQRGDVAASASSSGEGPPVRSYTIDLSNNPTHTAPLQPMPLNVGAAGNDIKPAPQPDQSNVTSDSVSAAPPPAAPIAMPAAAPITPRPPRVTPAPVPAPATAASKAVQLSLAANSGHQAPAVSRTASGGGWAVQLGLFAKRDNAERLARVAQAKGFAVSVSNADAKGLYRVYAGGMADRTAAEAYTQRLKDQGLPAAVIASP
jgi:DedD protein